MHTCSKTNVNIQIDTGGIAKGLCVDLLVNNLNLNGFYDVLVDWGSDIKATGLHPNGRKWCTAFMKPPSTKQLFQQWQTPCTLNLTEVLEIIDVESMGAATSGDYLQVFKYG